jgi:major membrane immunogen (membrane-anchored lipoprotein)
MKTKTFWVLGLIFISAVCYYLLREEALVDSLPYKDGVYQGSSQSKYLSENYFGETKLIIHQGRIVKVNFRITDRDRNEVFNENYEKHYSTKRYIEQCRKDLEGVRIYPRLLLKNQDINNVDAITGATWSYNLFKDSVLKALGK